MALVVKDRVRETTSTAGTGTVTLAGAVLGFQAFSVIGDGNVTYYAIVDPTAGDWEVGIGTYTSAGTTLSRDTVLESSNGGALVSFTGNIKDVFVTYPAEKAVYFDTADAVNIDNLKLDGNTISSTNTNGNIVLAPNGSGDVQLDADTVRVGDSNAAATVTTNGTGNLTISTNGGTNSGTIVINQGVDGNIAISPNGTGTVIINTDLDVDNVNINGNTISTTDTNGNLTFTPNGTGYGIFSGTQAILLPKGNNTTERPGTPVSGMLRYNTTINEFEGYNGTAWASVGGSAISNDTSTASDLYPAYLNATTGTATNIYTSNAKLLYRPSTGELKVSAPVASNGILVNNTTVAASYTIATSTNGLSVGPITVNSGITVTVSSGQRWLVL